MPVYIVVEPENTITGFAPLDIVFSGMSPAGG